MKISIMQPAFLPWLGYFERIAKSDLHIILDHIPMDRSSKTRFTNRNKIRTHDGWMWLTVPLKTTKRSDAVPINKLEINYEDQWQKKHIKAIKNNYSKSPFCAEYSDLIEDIYSSKAENLNCLLTDSTSKLLECLGINTPCKRSSDMDATMSKDELILELCGMVDATEYISGPFGRDYLKTERFEEEGIQLIYHDYSHPWYKQAFDGFEPCMSVIDLLFNHGDKSLEILNTSQ